jgi:hypothetical protein
VASAASLASLAVTPPAGHSEAIASAIAPEPVPRSSTRGMAPTPRLVAQHTEHPLHQAFGLGARHEHAGIDGEIEARETPRGR